LRILAGAGIRKITALASRVAWPIASGTPPERVLLLTFTPRAARQMLSRAESLLAQLPDGRRSSRVQGGTFHSVAHRMLRQHAAALDSHGRRRSSSSLLILVLVGPGEGLVVEGVVA
jgi:DNA helicase II / ATP-dependent DNA helicase PcrA